MRIVASLMVLALAVGGCSSGSLSSSSPNLARGGEAYATISAQPAEQAIADYRIGALDEISVSVFQEPELSVEKLQVDASGNISLPLVGVIPAAGKTGKELSDAIEARLGAKYLEDPQVTVSVAGSVSQKVVVQGEVNEAGVYEIKGRTTLLEALAMAKGETKIAALREVVVFRNINGQRMGAMFDVQSIRRGNAEDPQILGNDVVVVGYSHAKSIWRDVLSAAPVFAIFRPFR